MAIIYTYPYDIVIQDKDAWIGTEASNRQTKQYTAEALANYLNTIKLPKFGIWAMMKNKEPNLFIKQFKNIFKIKTQ
jgi:folylpolyglutamate synthase/dihydropteroate synthase